MEEVHKNFKIISQPQQGPLQVEQFAAAQKWLDDFVSSNFQQIPEFFKIVARPDLFPLDFRFWVISHALPRMMLGPGFL